MYKKDKIYMYSQVCNSIHSYDVPFYSQHSNLSSTVSESKIQATIPWRKSGDITRYDCKINNTMCGKNKTKSANL